MTTALGGTDAPAFAAAPTERWTAWRTARVLLGLALGVLALLPVYRVLGVPETGLAGAATVGITGAASSFLWSSMLLLLIPVVLLTRLLPAQSPARAVASVHRLIVRPRTRTFAMVTGGLALAVVTAFSLFVLRGQPNLVDAMSQLVHARYIAAGHLAGPPATAGAAWTMQQSLFTPNGWVSLYPPGHVLVLAAALRLGVPWAAGPLMLAVAAVFTLLAAERLLPGRLAVARLAAILVAISPFLVAHAGAFMNHTTAAACAALAIWCAARADEAGGAWTVGAGASIGAMFATRPLSGVGLGVVIGLWLMSDNRLSVAQATKRLLVFAAGTLPFIAGVGAYNLHFFGSPTTFGYTAALGAAGGPGFGIDPWGNTYGLTQAVAYTSAELTALSSYLLEAPLPIIALIAVWLILSPRLERGLALILAWATVPVLLQLTYWHHGLFMGPRMLNESAPAWIVLAVVAAISLAAAAPDRLEAAPAWSPRTFVTLLFGGALVAGCGIFTPMRLMSYAQRPQAYETTLEASSPALIFVHGGWTSRLSMRLAAGGMRLDSVETALRQNPTCAVQTWADAMRDDRRLPDLDFDRRATRLPRPVELSPGNRIRVGPGETSLSGECGRQAAADRLGVLDVTPLLWRGDLPGLTAEGRMYVRDLGPDANRATIAAFPGRTAFMLMTESPDGPPRLVPYDAAVKRLWGEAGA